MDVDVDRYRGLLLNTILLRRVQVIRGRLMIRRLELLFVYIGRMLMRILVRDGGRRMIGIQLGLLLDVDRIGLAALSVLVRSEAA